MDPNNVQYISWATKSLRTSRTFFVLRNGVCIIVTRKKTPKFRFRVSKSFHKNCSKCTQTVENFSVMIAECRHAYISMRFQRAPTGSISKKSQGSHQVLICREGMSTIIDETSLTVDIERKIDQILKTELPLSRVKKIAKLDPQVNLLNNEASRLVAKSTELFLIELAKACFTQASGEKRKTIQKKDLDRVIKADWMFEFLEDALDGWPEPGRSKIFGESTDILDETEDLNGTAELNNTAELNGPTEVNNTANDEIVQAEDEEDTELMDTMPIMVENDANTADESENEDLVEETPDIFD